jgi:hypothetical protein
MTTAPDDVAHHEKLVAFVVNAGLPDDQAAQARAVLAGLPADSTIVDFLRALDRAGARDAGQRLIEWLASEPGRL